MNELCLSLRAVLDGYGEVQTCAAGGGPPLFPGPPTAGRPAGWWSACPFFPFFRSPRPLGAVGRWLLWTGVSLISVVSSLGRYDRPS